MIGRILAGLCLVLSVFPSANAEQAVTKEHCLSGVGQETVGQLKQELMMGAKRQAVGELFGELISSTSKMEDFQLTEDMVSAYSSGYVRIKGDAIFRNGPNLAEVCVKIEAYVTDEDLARLRPIAIERKICHADENMTTGKLKAFTKEKAIVSSLLDHDRRLEGIAPRNLLPLVHSIQTLSSGFIPDSETFCTHISGTVMPVEVVSMVQNKLSYMPTKELIVHLPASALTASSYHANDLNGHGPPNARYDQVTTNSNWSSAGNNPDQWLQVDLGGSAIIRAIGTKGRSRGASQWVTSYKLQYSNDGVHWVDYSQNGGPHVFKGNSDNNSEVRHNLLQPFRARYLRFLPQAWNSHITMRVEAYGVFVP